jgi:hypothetical protein
MTIIRSYFGQFSDGIETRTSLLKFLSFKFFKIIKMEHYVVSLPLIFKPIFDDNWIVFDSHH